VRSELTSTEQIAGEYQVSLAVSQWKRMDSEEDSSEKGKVSIPLVRVRRGTLPEGGSRWTMKGYNTR
jgi:hypothetical protein